MFKINGKPIAPNTAFTLGDGEDAMQYPANWIANATQEERDAIGLVEEPDPIYPDDRFYFVTGNEDGTYTSTPKDLDILKAGFITASRNSTNAQLSRTDWYLYRAIDPSSMVAIPAEVTEERTSIRAKATQYEASITGAETLDALIEVVTAPADAAT